MRGRLDQAVAAGRAAVRAALADVPPGGIVLAGVSGGADSLALAASLAFIAERADWQAHAVVVDHQLQAGSGEVAARAAEQCRALGLSADIATVEVGRTGGAEAAARDARYTALHREATARDASAICLAHTLDDQAETVMLGLGRGSGPRSLAGMPRRSGLIRRPFLELRRSDTEQICAALDLLAWHDPHNADPAYRRVRIRRELLPLAEDILGGGVAESLARTASHLRRDAELLDSLAATWADARPGELPVSELAATHPAIRTRLLHRAAIAAGAAPGELSARHIEALDTLVTDPRGGRRIELPGQVTAERDGDHLTFAPTPMAR